MENEPPCTQTTRCQGGCNPIKNVLLKKDLPVSRTLALQGSFQALESFSLMQKEWCFGVGFLFLQLGEHSEMRSAWNGTAHSLGLRHSHRILLPVQIRALGAPLPCLVISDTPFLIHSFLSLQIKTCKALYHKSKANRSMKRQLYAASEVSQRFPSQLYISSGINLGAKQFWQSFNTFMPVIWQRKRTLRCLTCSSGLY